MTPRARGRGLVERDVVRDLLEIGDRLVGPDQLQWTQVLGAVAQRAAALPLAGRVVPEFDRENVREMIKRGYRVVDLVRDDQVEILGVLEEHRLLPTDILDR